jgi:hypothetical protein
MLFGSSPLIAAFWSFLHAGRANFSTPRRCHRRARCSQPLTNGRFPLATSDLLAKPLKMNTCTKTSCNHRVMNTYGLLNLKPRRMNTYDKIGVAVIIVSFSALAASGPKQRNPFVKLFRMTTFQKRRNNCFRMTSFTKKEGGTPRGRTSIAKPLPTQNGLSSHPRYNLSSHLEQTLLAGAHQPSSYRSGLCSSHLRESSYAL